MSPCIQLVTRWGVLACRLLKAVGMSQYGVIHVGKIDQWRRKTMLLDLLSNNDGNLATSDTRGITDQVLEELRGARESYWICLR